MIPPIDIRYIVEALDRIGEVLKEAAEDHPKISEKEGEPQALLDVLRELLNTLCQPPDEALGSLPRASEPSKDKTILGDRGLKLLGRLAALAFRLQRPKLVREIEMLSVPLACWVARCEGEILQLNLIVDGAAALANHLKTPQELAQLYGLLQEINFALSPRITQSDRRQDPQWPWRIFLLNKAIVATRSHQPAFMEEAFAQLVEQLPEEASDFFQEGMEQMGALDYPQPVREMMERWFAQWCELRTLH